MYNFLKKLLLSIVFGGYILLYCLIPFKLHKLSLLVIFGEIFPAFDIAIIFYFSSHINIRQWFLFIIGILIDHMHQVPLGINSFIFIITNSIFYYFSKFFILREKFINIMTFYVYSFFVISFRYILINNKYPFEGKTICFYYLMTIFSYPVLRFLIHKPFSILREYGRQKSS